VEQRKEDTAVLQALSHRRRAAHDELKQGELSGLHQEPGFHRRRRTKPSIRELRDAVADRLREAHPQIAHGALLDTGEAAKLLEPVALARCEAYPRPEAEARRGALDATVRCANACFRSLDSGCTLELRIQGQARHGPGGCNDRVRLSTPGWGSRRRCARS